MASSDVETHSAIPAYQPGEDWDSLLDTADEIIGYDLAKDETADDLVGVPLIITRVQFRPGVMRDKKMQAYVTCECRVAPALDLRLINIRREASRLSTLSSLESLAFGPDSHIVFNDGSTGVYRQIVKYLHTRGFIELAEVIVDEGHYGETSFDMPPGDWSAIHQGTEQTITLPNSDLFTTYTADIRLYCPRGLRLSLYENEYTQTGKTRYLG